MDLSDGCCVPFVLLEMRSRYPGRVIIYTKPRSFRRIPSINYSTAASCRFLKQRIDTLGLDVCKDTAISQKAEKLRAEGT